MKKILTTITASVLMATTGCASIVSDSQYTMAITSSPDDAIFTITNENGQVVSKGHTPSTISLDASNGFFDGADYTIKYHKGGYEDSIVTVSSSVDGWYVGNILFGGFIGLLIVDPATGAMWKLPKTASQSLLKNQNADQEGKQLTLMSLDKVPGGMKPQLQKVSG
ncbi:hypothetical protein JCM19231_1323 [Vibrio ishigakensis]|uniref:Lipoprotein n=1 Tax=Vibrio ishigakensis TaxID=1481914 RepID=A0A0B8P2V1_9VIBR|nr:hypothetical protein [Vibrio ishigakensis]GAM57294.1 hypothetical protein JCM19231_1323 [Vibrio ishigakensis]